MIANRPADADSSAAPAGLVSRVRDSIDRQQFMTTLGARLVLIADGRVGIALPAVAGLTQQHGYVHAGVIASVADTACGYAAYTLMPDGHDVLTIEFKLNLLAPAAGEEIEARAEVVRAGRTLTVCRGDVYARAAGTEALVATMLATIIGRRAMREER